MSLFLTLREDTQIENRVLNSIFRSEGTTSLKTEYIWYDNIKKDVQKI
jgi:hypothetical protein